MKKSSPVCWHPKGGKNILKTKKMMSAIYKCWRFQSYKPSHNANAKKVFSLMQAPWTKERNKLN